MNKYVQFNHRLIEINLRDQRHISDSQRKFAFLLLSSIDDVTNGDLEYTKMLFYTWFQMYAGLDSFSMSDRLGDVNTTNVFIDFLIEFMTEHKILIKATGRPVLDDRETSKMEYAALMNKQCVVCGKVPSELHHIDAIGSGNDRRKISHVGRRAVQLCVFHHREADSSLGWVKFADKYHLQGIKLTADMTRQLKLGDWSHDGTEEQRKTYFKENENES